MEDKRFTHKKGVPPTPTKSECSVVEWTRTAQGQDHMINSWHVTKLTPLDPSWRSHVASHAWCVPVVPRGGGEVWGGGAGKIDAKCVASPVVECWHPHPPPPRIPPPPPVPHTARYTS